MGVYAGKRGGGAAKRKKPRPFGKWKQKVKRRARVPRRFYRRRAVMPSVGKLLDAKVNTAIEKRMKQMIDRKADSARLNCVLRLSQGRYLRQTNEWSAPIECNFTGNYLELAVIPRQDVNLLPAPLVADTAPNTLPGGTNEDESNTEYGTSIGILANTRHGHRTNDTVKLRSFYVKWRLRMKESTGTNSVYAETRVHIAIVKVVANFQEHYNPVVAQLLPFRAWNYSHALDLHERPATFQIPYKVTVLAKETVTIKFEDDYPHIEYGALSYKFPKPTIHEFQRSNTHVNNLVAPAQVSGGSTESTKYFFVYRSETPDGAEYTKAEMWNCSFTNYYDE